MKIENLRLSFKESLKGNDFEERYLHLNLEYSQREYKSLVLEKIPTSLIKKEFKDKFLNYKVSSKHGGYYLERLEGEFIISFFFDLKKNIFLPYFHIYLGNCSNENLINYYNLTSGTAICRFLKNDYDYPIKSKVFTNLTELMHLVVDEVHFFEDFVTVFLENVRSNKLRE